MIRVCRCSRFRRVQQLRPRQTPPALAPRLVQERTIRNYYSNRAEINRRSKFTVHNKPNLKHKHTTRHDSLHRSLLSRRPPPGRVKFHYSVYDNNIHIYAHDIDMCSRALQRYDNNFSSGTGRHECCATIGMRRV